MVILMIFHKYCRGWISDHPPTTAQNPENEKLPSHAAGHALIGPSAGTIMKKYLQLDCGVNLIRK